MRRPFHLTFPTKYQPLFLFDEPIKIPFYTDSNWRAAYDGQTITYDAIGNPLNDGRRRYEWQAGRQLKKVYVKADLKEGTKAGVDEQTGTVLKIEWSNSNLLEGEVTSTQASATVTRCGEDVTEEYPASAFNWVRDSGDVEADNAWNAAHAGMKSISLTTADLGGDPNGDVKLTCTLTASSATYGSITVDDDMDASHTPAELDANDVFVIENGNLKVTTSRGNVYALENGRLKAAEAKLNGSITAETKLFASQPEDMVEFSYNHNGLRTQKKVTKADGTVETTDYILHGKIVTHLRRGSDEMHFFYDAQSKPVKVSFNGELYSYIHNILGDVVGIIDGSGNVVVEYKYDVWGRYLSVERMAVAYDVLAELNPFRYREYMWDGTIGLYYLKSRYYNQEYCRIINEDMLVARYMRFGDNLYTYCANNPVVYKDQQGTLAAANDELSMEQTYPEDVSQSTQVIVNSIEYTEYSTNVRLSVIHTSGVITEYHDYYIEMVTSEQLSGYQALKNYDGNVYDNIAIGGAGIAIDRLVMPKIEQAALKAIGTNISGWMVVLSALSLIYEEAEKELDDELSRTVLRVQAKRNGYGIAYIERRSWMNIESVRSYALPDERYYCEWDESGYNSLVR